MRGIAVELGRDVSTISRELSRNRDDRQRYRPFAAQQLATARLARNRPRRVEQDLVLAAAVQAKLDVKWSPEQISNTLAQDFPDDPSRRLSTESIYQALYAKGVVLQRDPTLCLRSRRRRRRPHSRPGQRRPNTGQGPGARPPISDRPAEADDRTVAGHWEGDLITGRSNRSAIATLVERASGALMLVHLPGTHTTEVTVSALTAVFTALPPGLCRSLTWDRGTEMADHALLTLATGM
ncbi:MAG: IS30 family transposase, partial [Ornithinibacter sp.]